jgi:hypothetical protein
MSCFTAAKEEALELRANEGVSLGATGHVG